MVGQWDYYYYCSVTVCFLRNLGANLTIRTAPSGAVIMIASTETISTMFAICASIDDESILCIRIWSKATGPNAACTVAFGKPDIVMYKRSFQFNWAPKAEAYAMLNRICQIV